MFNSLRKKVTAGFMSVAIISIKRRKIQNIKDRIVVKKMGNTMLKINLASAQIAVGQNANDRI